MPSSTMASGCPVRPARIGTAWSQAATSGRWTQTATGESTSFSGRTQAGIGGRWEGLRQAPDLMVSVRNGFGGSIGVQYQPSTAFQQTQLPFALQVVSTLTTADGNGLTATTQYSYSGGYFQVAEKDFRGFAATTVTGPAWPSGARPTTTTWFHQGNDVAIGANDRAPRSAT